jgi:hypothetical protein
MGMSKEWMKKNYLNKFLINWMPTGRRKRGRPKKDGKKAYLELCKNMVYGKETVKTLRWRLGVERRCHTS